MRGKNGNSSTVTVESTPLSGGAAPSRGRFANTGNGPTFQFIDIGHRTYMALVDPDTAFWALIKSRKLGEVLSNGHLLGEYRKKSLEFSQEMDVLRFGLKPSAVYMNPTERCNLNCRYCYIPEEMRSDGQHMSENKLADALTRLKAYFTETVPEGALPQIVFHGSEPLLNKDAVFSAIERFGGDFRFGIQTNATLLDEEAIEFLTARGVGIGISLDGHTASVAGRTRRNWAGDNSFNRVVTVMERLSGYQGFNVICTVTRENMRHLTQIVDFFHEHGVAVCLLNPVRCTRQGARDIRPTDSALAKHFLAALDRTRELYEKTRRKLVVANFANILIGIVAPTARRLMCDISPCGGGRCFFALSAKGDLFPCSEFIGLPHFAGGNIFKDHIEKALKSTAFTRVTGRRIEDIEPCRRCAIRHFCGSPCPAEAHEMNGGMHRTGAFCEFYEEQVRYALRVIADEREDSYLWDGWNKGTRQSFAFRHLAL